MRTRRKNLGFTLIELVIVVTILVILTGMIVAKLDVLEMKAQKGVAAADMGDVFRFVQTYRVITTTYPDGWDSLVQGSDGQLPKSDVNNNIPGLHGELTGGPPFPAGDPTELVAGTLSTGEIASLGREGITTLYDFPNTGTANAWPDIAGNMPGNPLTGAPTSLTRNLPTASNTFCARLNVSSNLASAFAVTGATTPGGLVSPVAEPDVHAKADSVVASIYKAAGGQANIPANKTLVVLGFGRLNTAVGSVSQNSLMPEAPFYPNQNQNLLYNRFLCVFECDVTGVRARLVAVLGADGDRMYDEIGDFYAQNP